MEKQATEEELRIVAHVQVDILEEPVTVPRPDCLSMMLRVLRFARTPDVRGSPRIGRPLTQDPVRTD